jgi:hypothetical protein
VHCPALVKQICPDKQGDSRGTRYDSKNGEVALRHDKSVQRRIRDARFPVINARLGIPHRSDRY